MLPRPRLAESRLGLLSGPLGTFWRYRLVCDIQDEALRVLVVEIGHRRDVYR